MFDRQQFIKWVKEYTTYPLLEEECRNAFNGWDIRDPIVTVTKLKDVVSVLERIVELVEKFSKDISYLSGKDKLDLATEFIDDLVRLPFYAEWFDGAVIRILISSIVTQYNKFYGKAWIDAIKKPS